VNEAFQVSFRPSLGNSVVLRERQELPVWCISGWHRKQLAAAAAECCRELHAHARDNVMISPCSALGKCNTLARQVAHTQLPKQSKSRFQDPLHPVNSLWARVSTPHAQFHFQTGFLFFRVKVETAPKTIHRAAPPPHSLASFLLALAT
jgi:hypothetical protein